MSHKIAITVQAIDKATATLKSVSGEVGNLGDKADSTSRDLQPLGVGLVAIGAAGAAVMGVAVMTAARVEVLGTVLYTVGDNAGYTKEQLDAFEASLVANGITVGASRQGLVQMMQASLDLADATGLARLAQDAAVIANKNSSEAYTDLITVIQTGRSVMAKSLGLTVDFAGAYRQMAEQLGKSVRDLTEAEKMQARLNEVMAAGEEISGVYEAAMGDVGKKLGSLKGDFEDAANALGKNYLPEAEAVVDITRDMLQAFVDLAPEQQETVANFIAVGTAITGVTGTSIVLLPQILAIGKSLVVVGGFAKSTAFGLQLLAAGATTSGLGLAGVTATVIAGAAPLAALAAAMWLVIEAAQAMPEWMKRGQDAIFEAGEATIWFDGVGSELKITLDEVGVATSDLTDGWMSQYIPALVSAREQTTGWEANLLGLKQPIGEVATLTNDLGEAAAWAAVTVGDLGVSTSTFAGSLGELDFKNEAIWEMALAAGANNEQMAALAVNTGKVTQAEADLNVKIWAATEAWVAGQIPLSTYFAIVKNARTELSLLSGEFGTFLDALNSIQPSYAINIHTTYTETGVPPVLGPPAPSSGGGGGSDGSGGGGGGGPSEYQHGTSYVPYTGYAYLHEGEAVLTREENRRRGEGGSRVVVNNYFGQESVRTDEDIQILVEQIQASLELQGQRERIV